ncbi:MAG: DNA recombination/repair protein RecA, partial [Caldilineaceae bacterium]|nr:DNA recombination/repair protein RecA [Caldilineaceae bacterium]
MAKRGSKKNDVVQVANEGRVKALDAALSDITKRYGDGTIIRLGDASHMQVDVIPSGSLGLDIAIGVGGIPRGRITEIYGPESSGKTTLCLHVIAEAQKRGGLCAFIDMEHALDPAYAQRIGVDIETLYVTQPDTGEQALEITETLVRSGALDVIVVDSVAALVPRAEIEGEMGDSHVGLQARLMSQALRKLSGIVKQSGLVLLFTN